MSKRRILATFLLLPLFMLLERGAWYGARAIQFLFRIGDPSEGGLGMEPGEVASERVLEQLLVPLVVLLAGALGAAAGPQVLLLLGALVALPGMVWLGFATPSTAGIAIVVVLLGHSLTMPGVMASAATALRGRAEHLRTALMALLYAAINLGAFAGSAATGELQANLGFSTVFLGCAGVMALALLVAALLGGATLWTRAEVAANPEPAPPMGGLLLGAGGLMVLVLVPWLCSLQAYELVFTTVDLAALPPWLQERWFHLNPLLCIVTGLLLAGAAAGLHFARVRLPSLFLVAAGLLILALAQALLLVAGSVGSPWTAMAGVALAAVGEATTMVFLTSRLLGDQHWRLVALVNALWLASTYGFSSLIGWVGGLFQESWYPQLIGWTGVVTGLLAALILAAAAIPAQRRLWSVPER
jgi:hypothetical protein